MSTNPSKGRVVLNHSTHVEGLIPILKKLATIPGVSTITPGVLRRMRSRPSPLSIRLSVPIRGGFKMQAKKGTTVQEVFVITTLERPELEAAILTAMGKKRK